MHPDCVSAFNDLKLHKGGAKYIIYKISDDQKEIVVEEVGKDQDYNVFREKLTAAKEKSGKSRPSYAIYDIEFELDGGEGKRCNLILQNSTRIMLILHRSKIAFITYINQDDSAVKVLRIPSAHNLSHAN